MGWCGRDNSRRQMFLLPGDTSAALTMHSDYGELVAQYVKRV